MLRTSAKAVWGESGMHTLRMRAQKEEATRSCKLSAGRFGALRKSSLSFLLQLVRQEQRSVEVLAENGEAQGLLALISA